MVSGIHTFSLLSTLYYIRFCKASSFHHPKKAPLPQGEGASLFYKNDLFAFHIKARKNYMGMGNKDGHIIVNIYE